MHRVIIHVPEPIDFDIYSYGLTIMLGFMMAIWVAGRRSRIVGLDPLICIDLTVFLLVGGILGARLMFVLHFHEDIFLANRSAWENFKAAINIRDGGLEFYGGLILAVPIALWYLRRRKVPLGLMLDVALPTVAIGLAFGRMGCFLNGCCYGRIVDEGNWPWNWIAMAYPQFDSSGLPVIPFHEHLEKGLLPTGPDAMTYSWVVNENNAAVDRIDPKFYPIGTEVWGHTAPMAPAQLISSMVNLMVFVIVGAFWHRVYDPVRLAARKARGLRVRHIGEVAAVYVITYAIVRFILELFRADTSAVALSSLKLAGKHGLTISQVISVVILIGAVPVYLLLRSGRIGSPVELMPGDTAPGVAPAG